MADVITRLKVDSQEYNNKIRRAASEITSLASEAQKAGGKIDVLNKDNVKLATSFGNMNTVAKTAKGRIGELSGAFTEASIAYRRLTDEEKNSPFGRGLAQSLETLKKRIHEAKKELEDINAELRAVPSSQASKSFGGFQITGLGDARGMLTELGGSLGMNNQLLSVLSTGSIAAAGAIAGVAAAAAAAAKEFYDYNTELAHQNQIVEVTTGLMGENADAMRNQMSAVAKVYGVDFRESVNAANTLMQKFGLSSDQSITLVRKGMQGMIKEDSPKMLQMIQQYSSAFKDAGISASELVAIIHNTEGGLFSDEHMNAITMGIGKIRQMSSGLSSDLKSIGIDADDMTKKLNDGSMTSFEALQIVAEKITELGPSSQAAGDILKDVFGKQGVTAGTDAARAIASINTNLEETSKQTGEVGVKMEELTNVTAALEEEMNKAFGIKNFETFKVDLEKNVNTTLLGVMTKFNQLTESISLSQGQIEAFGKIAVNSIPGLGQFAGLLDKIASYFHDAGEEALAAKDKIANFPQLPSSYSLEGIGKAAAAAGQPNKPIHTPTTRHSSHSSSGSSSSSHSTTPKVEKTEEQKIQEKINKLLDEAAKLTKSNDEAKKKAIRTQIEGLQQQLEEIKRIKDEVLGKLPVEGSIDWYSNKLQELKKKLNAEADATVRDDIKKQIDETQAILDNLQGKEIKVKVTTTISTSPLERLNSELELTKKSMSQATDSEGWIMMNNHLKDVQGRIVDITTAQNLLNEIVEKSSISEEFNEWAKSIGLSETIGKEWEKALNGDNIPDETWTKLTAKINEQLANLGIEPIKIDVKTGALSNANKEVNKLAKGWNTASSMMQTASQALNSFQNPAAKVAGIIAQTVAALAAAYAANLAQDKTTKGNIWAFIAAAAAATVSMGVTIAEVKKNAKMANGGFTTAANGVITGSHFSGDVQPLMVNAGEGVINQADQAALFRAIKEGNFGGGGSIQSVGVRGTDLLLCLNNELRSQGKPTL